MSTAKFTIIKSSLILVIVSFLGTSLTIGYAAETNILKELNDPELPQYLVGTTFIYSNRTWEKVTGVDSESVGFIDYRGYRTQRLKDFTFRPSVWETSKSYGERSYDISDGIFFKKPDSIWPLKNGNEIYYFEVNEIPQKSGFPKTYRYYWHCSVVGKEKVSVLAGEFDTYKIIAKKYFPSKKSSIQWRETITWHYAPEVNYYVKITKERFKKKTLKKELMAILPPLKQYSKMVQKGLKDTLQNTLEIRNQGQLIEFRSDDEQIRMTVKPGSVFKMINGTYGRRYVQEILTPLYQKTFYGMAFRNSAGVWITPMR